MCTCEMYIREKEDGYERPGKKKLALPSNAFLSQFFVDNIISSVLILQYKMNV